MEDSATAQNATNILPIPPALEFPFPKAKNETSTKSKDLTLPSKKNRTVEGRNVLDSNHQASATVPAQDTPPASRPGPPKAALSERPLAAQRGSFLGLRHYQTAFEPTALTDATRGHTSYSDSSGNEQLQVSSLPSYVSRSSNKYSNLSSAKYDKKRRFNEDQFAKFSVGNDDYNTQGSVSKRDGRLNISVNETSNRGYLAHALGATLKHRLKKPGHGGHHDHILGSKDKPKRPDLNARLSALSIQSTLEDRKRVPPLNIVIMVIGSRGDIQPFLKVGKLLKEDYGHRVRIATHPAFKNFVEQDSGLEFFSVGGDPAELMAFMVKNPGLIPSVSTVKTGEVGRRRDSMFEMFQGFWRACINATDDEYDISNLEMMGDKHPFVADAIIANPPSFAHVHCAERLGVPLHLMFTFPYSPTQQFPHPLANIRNSNVDTNYTNFMSYPLVDMVTWQGLGDLVNRFRVKTLGLEPVSTLWAPGQLHRLKVPYTYMWSPGLIPKPEDWGPEIDIAGFVFLDLASCFKPPSTLVEFLNAGEPPVYIGFGSIVVDDPDMFTSLIFKAVKKAGVRALVSKGWGGLGHEGNTPENVYMLENTPHDWLFPRVSAVVHHGGAGTTAIGLKCGKPTMIVPFFGDQPFWGAMVAKAGAGAHEPVPYKYLTADALAEGITQCLKPEAKEAAAKLAKNISDEGDGARNAAESFQHYLPIRGERSLCCSILPDHVAVWTLKHSNLRLSALAAELLIREKKIKWQDLHLLRHYEWNDFEGPGEPLTGGGMAIVNSVGGAVTGVGSLPIRWARTIKKNEKKRGTKREDKGNSQAEGNSRAQTLHNASEVQANSIAREDAKRAPRNSKQAGNESTSPHNHVDRNYENGEKQKDLPNGVSPTNQGNYNERASSSVVESTDDHLLRDLVEETGTGFARTGEALARVPMDLSLAIAQGFHNAPRLYGDGTVRTAPHISGIQSGLRAAGTEFTFGIYDGFTGLLLQPYNGARQGGAIGFVQGVGKGIGGFILKDLAAIIGPLGYTMKGVHKEMIRSRQPTAFIRRARIIKGLQDMQELDQKTREREMETVNAAWHIICEIRKEDEAHKQEGMRGRVAVLRQHEKMRKHGAFEDVEEAKRVLRSKQEERREREREITKDKSGGEERKGVQFLNKRIVLPKPFTKSNRDGESGSRGSSRMRQSESDAERQVWSGNGQQEPDAIPAHNGKPQPDSAQVEGHGLGGGVEHRAASAAA